MKKSQKKKKLNYIVKPMKEDNKEIFMVILITKITKWQKKRFNFLNPFSVILSPWTPPSNALSVS